MKKKAKFTYSLTKSESYWYLKHLVKLYPKFFRFKQSNSGKIF